MIQQASSPRTPAGRREGGAVEKVVLFNVREGVSEAACIAMAERGRAMLGTIPGVERVSIGVAVKPDARYRYCALLRFRDADVIAIYNAHPTHDAFLHQEWEPIVADVLPIEFAMRF